MKFLHRRPKLHGFIMGVLAAIIGVRFLKSKVARKIAVRGVAEGLRLKSDALRNFEEIREEAQDIYEEAKRETDQGQGKSGGAKGKKQ
ncbi:hypothetical protein R80B4_03282 [Fibrobacteres bacterium R8-0-B4]